MPLLLIFITFFLDTGEEQEVLKCGRCSEEQEQQKKGTSLLPPGPTIPLSHTQSENLTTDGGKMHFLIGC